ncbi:MerR-like DNA binding protein [Actinomadura pelletieri DSM 43383]|uniref:MerR-like DNA binding protein n=1 Tax=Actinomadura pelletieri DSM 43383 TaxID=1120940 RepID=A0A495QFM6_9ACTN|nr:MerR family transcriptional regulator [Actinomadura pelletieri]RKS70732.1 MerR-like DNA binding protein [Actinomadura pelletieri DSM 43383]
MDGTWTIGELAEHAAAALSADGSTQVSGRVRDLPNARLIRWYTTIGLIDPPLGRRGRTALYGRRHLLQLVAVKRRQATGRSIAEIQVELATATDETLQRIAALPTPPAAAPAPPAASAPPSDRTDKPSRPNFWNARPDVSFRQAALSDDYGEPPPPVVQGVRLAPDLTLLLDVPVLNGDDLAAIENAARPLLQELRRRGLISASENPTSQSARPTRRSQ